MGIFIVGLWCVILSIYDIRQRRLPDFLTLPGAAVITLWALVVDPTWILGGLLWAGIYFVTAVLVGGIGGGDIKFALGLGTVVMSWGISAVFFTIVGASLISALASAILVIMGKIKRPGSVPHGPSMVVASACALVICG